MKRAWIWLAVVACGCGDSGKPQGSPADPGPTKIVEDLAGGFRLAVPESWGRMEFPARAPENRRFAAAWGPQNITLPQEGILVQVLAPGCPAADLGSKFSGQLLASTREAKGYSVSTSGPAAIGSRQGFRTEAKFGSEIGDLFEAAAYVEASPGAGVLVASRGPAGQEALIRARLDKALGAFESFPRKVQLGKPEIQAWGLSFALPGGFEPFVGSQIPHGVAGYWVGASANHADKQAAMEAVTLFLLPDTPGAPELMNAAVGLATKGRKRGEMRKGRTKNGQEVEMASFSPESADQARYEVAVAGIRTKGGLAALAVNAGIAPEGRALSVLEAILQSMTVSDPPLPELATRRFGEGGFRSGAIPKDWKLQESPDSLGALLMEKLTNVPEGVPPERSRVGVNTSFGEDRLGDDTPESLALWYYGRIDRKKAMPLKPDALTIADGREVARLVVILPGHTEVIAFARCGPAAMAEIHVSAISEDGPLAAALAVELAASAKLLPVSAQEPPSEEVLAASRAQVAGIVERGRAGRSAESYYLNRARKADAKPTDPWSEDVSALKATASQDGRWTDFLRSPDLDPKRKPEDKIMVETTQEGRPGLVTEAVVMRGPLDPRTKRTEAKYATTVETDGSFMTVRRTPEGGESRTDRFPVADLLLPPDLTVSDGALVGLAGSPEGRYAFQVIHERFLTPRWREYVVKGEEEVETAMGNEPGKPAKMKARRIEMTGRGTAWVAEGRVIRLEGTQTVRLLCDEKAANRFLK